MNGPPNLKFIFNITYSNHTVKSVPVYDWNRGGAWAHICRDLNKMDHGDTNQVESISLTAIGICTQQQIESTQYTHR